MAEQPAGDEVVTIACREFVELVTEHLEGTLPDEVEQAIAAHLELCDPCLVYLDQIRSTAAALRSLPAPALPEPARQRLLDVFTALRAGAQDGVRARCPRHGALCAPARAADVHGARGDRLRVRVRDAGRTEVPDAVTGPVGSMPAGGGEPEPAVADVRAELARYQALVEYAPDAIVILDLDAGHFVTVNGAAEQLFGMPRADLLRVGPEEVSPPVQPDGRPSGPAARAVLDRALAGEKPRFEWTHRRADGTDVACEITLLRLPDPDRRLVRGSIQDIRERQEAEAARAVRERRAGRPPGGRGERGPAAGHGRRAERDRVGARSGHVAVPFINERAEELLGYPAAQWLADEALWQRILHPDDREAALPAVRAAIADGDDFALTYRVRAADGRWVWLQHLAHVTRDEHGTPPALHAVLVDVTEAEAARAGRRRCWPRPAGCSPAPAAWRSGSPRSRAAGRRAGDWAAVWLRGDDDRYRPVAAAPAALADRVLGLGRCGCPTSSPRRCGPGGAFAVPEVTERAVARGDAPTTPARRAHRDRRRQLAGRAADHRRRRRSGCSPSPRDARPGYDEADVALAADLGQRMATMVAAERLAAQRRQLHEMTVALAAAGTVAEAAAALTTGLRDVLGASVVAVCTLGDDGQLHTMDVVGDPAGRWDEFTTMRLTARCRWPTPRAPAGRCGCPTGRPCSSATRRWRPACTRRPRRRPRCRCWSATGWSARSA